MNPARVAGTHGRYHLLPALPFTPGAAMTAFVRQTARPALSQLLQGVKADLRQHPSTAALLVTFGVMCLHALTYAPL